MHLSKKDEAIALAKTIQTCESCTARKEARKPVPGRGNVNAFVLCVGRNPGRTEDQRGLPFIGPTRNIIEGQLQAAGLNVQTDVFFTNLIDCYTTDNRPPETHEVRACWKWLRSWLQLIQPELVLTYGAMTSHYIVDVGTMEDNHGKVRSHSSGFYAIPCIHPGAQLYRHSMKVEIAKDTAEIARMVRQLRCM